VYKGRVLIVDDLSDWRSTLSGLLLDEGYVVSSASSRLEAFALLEAKSFHVAILDVRLDEADVDNQEGLQLMHQIRDKDPTVAIIILTGYATVRMTQQALQPNNQEGAPAFRFLEKSDFKHLVEYVRFAFEQVVRIDEAVNIEGEDQFLATLPKKLRFISFPKPPRERLLEEGDELLRKLFFGCERIQIQPIQRGYSGTAVFQVIPWYRDRGQGEAVIAKIGERGLVENEITRYKKLVQGVVGGHRIPKALDMRQTRSLTGILYTFAGLGIVKDFATFYSSVDTSEVLLAVEDLFLKTCFNWQSSSAFVSPALDLCRAYMELLRLTPEKLRRGLDSMMGGRHPFRKGDDRQWITLGDDIFLENPVEFALLANLQANTYISTIHGDMNGYNVLVDHRNETWLIDFANTCKGPLLYDYASFEVFLKVSLIETQDWQLFYKWERILLDTPDLRAPAQSPDLAAVSDIQKAHQIVLAIRRLALRERMGETDKTYLISLLFNSLKLLTVMDLPPLQRDRALISAALVVKRLQANLR
jgi:CheY-like chemotaxis protein